MKDVIVWVYLEDGSGEDPSLLIVDATAELLESVRQDIILANSVVINAGDYSEEQEGAVTRLCDLLSNIKEGREPSFKGIITTGKFGKLDSYNIKNIYLTTWVL